MVGTGGAVSYVGMDAGMMLRPLSVGCTVLASFLKLSFVIDMKGEL
jgi:hypothetical protein